MPTPVPETSLEAAATRAIEADLRAHTPARVSLARTGVSLTTRDTLRFALDHAQARDAVHAAFDGALLARRLEEELPILKEAGVAVSTMTLSKREA